MYTLWPHIERRLLWIDEYGDGFVQYATDSPIGLRNQGGKDSPDAVFGADGVTAAGPIALCDVAMALGYTARADRLWRQADALQVAFNHHFWPPIAASTRWRSTAANGPGAGFQRRGPPRWPPHCSRMIFLGPGDPHGRGRRAALQPALLSSGFGLAPR